MTVLVAILFTAFAWWFSTGLILLAVRAADRKGHAALQKTAIFTIPLLALGIVATLASASDPSVLGVYTGFLGALAIWGWIELAFLTGTITGPERRALPQDVAGWPRFTRAFATVSHHEAALLLGLFYVVVVTAETQNTIAFWTYLTLFFARISAKLNLFFGVPRINLEFVPTPLEHLKTYFRQAPITLMFPASIMVLNLAVACFLRELWVAATPANAVGFALLTTLAALALLEHWLMVLPLPDAKLWRWMLPAPKQMTAEGKTDGL